METKITKKELVDEIYALNIWRKRGFYEKWSKEELLNLYNQAVKIGKIKPKFTNIQIDTDSLLAIRGTLRMLLENNSQGLANKEQLEEWIIKLGGNI